VHKLVAAVSGSVDKQRNVKRSEGEVRGPVLDVLRDLLKAGQHEEVIRMSRYADGNAVTLPTSEKVFDGLATPAGG
jgi:hypothetical protein